jgi:THADA/TRM732, DUF2428
MAASSSQLELSIEQFYDGKLAIGSMKSLLKKLGIRMQSFGDTDECRQTIDELCRLVLFARNSTCGNLDGIAMAKLADAVAKGDVQLRRYVIDTVELYFRRRFARISSKSIENDQNSSQELVQKSIHESIDAPTRGQLLIKYVSVLVLFDGVDFFVRDVDLRARITRALADHLARLGRELNVDVDDGVQESRRELSFSDCERLIQLLARWVGALGGDCVAAECRGEPPESENGWRAIVRRSVALLNSNSVGLHLLNPCAVLVASMVDAVTDRRGTAPAVARVLDDRGGELPALFGGVSVRADFGRLALLRALMPATSLDAWLGDDAPLVGVLFGAAARACETAPTHKELSRLPFCALCEWMRRIGDIVRRHGGSAALAPEWRVGTAEFGERVFDRVRSVLLQTWESSHANAQATMRTVVEVLMALINSADDELGDASGERFEQMRCTLFDDVMALPWHARAKCEMMVPVVRHFGARKALLAKPDLFDSLVGVGLVSVARSSALSVFRDLVGSLVKSAPEMLGERVVPAIVRTLRNGSPAHQRSVLGTLAPLLRAAPSCFDALVDQFGDGASMRPLMLVMREARQLGLIALSDERVVALLRAALQHGDGGTRVAAFDCLCSVRRTSTPPTDVEYGLFRLFLEYCFDEADVDYCHRVAGLVRLFMVRVKCEASHVLSGRGRHCASSHAGDDVRAGYAQRLGAFLSWTCDRALESLYPCATHARCTLALEIYRDALVGVWGAQPRFAPDVDVSALVRPPLVPFELNNARRTRMLLMAVYSRFDELSTQAADTLAELLPTNGLAGFASGAEFDQCIVARWVLPLLGSARRVETDSAARVLSVGALKYGSQGWLPSAWLPSGAATAVATVDDDDNDDDARASMLPLVEACIARIGEQLDVAAQRREALAHDAPLHGTLLACQRVLDVIDLPATLACWPGSLERWRRAFTALVDVHLPRVAKVTLQIIGHQSAEFTSFSTANAQDSSLSGGTQQTATSGDVASDVASDNQLLLLNGWTSVKQSARLLAAVGIKAVALGGHGDSALLSLEHLRRIGDVLLDLITGTQQRGAIETSVEAFERYATSLLGASSAPLDALVSRWLDWLLDDVLFEVIEKRATRRGAGIPGAFRSLLRAEVRQPRAKSTALLDRAMARLVSIVSELGQLDGDARTPSQHAALVRSFYSLAMLIADSTLGARLERHLPAALQCALRGYHSPEWAVRSSSTRVFTAVTSRALVKQAGERTHLTSSTDFFAHFPELHAHCARSLRSLLESAAGDALAYAVLVLLSKMNKASSASSAAELDAPLVTLLEQCAAKRDFGVRAAAARAYANLVGDGDALSDAVERLANAALDGRSPANAVHGALLQLLELVKRRGCAPPRRLLDANALWRSSLALRCAPIAHALFSMALASDSDAVDSTVVDHARFYLAHRSSSSPSAMAAGARQCAARVLALASPPLDELLATLAHRDYEVRIEMLRACGDRVPCAFLWRLVDPLGGHPQVCALALRSIRARIGGNDNASAAALPSDAADVDALWSMLIDVATSSHPSELKFEALLFAGALIAAGRVTASHDVEQFGDMLDSFAQPAQADDRRRVVVDVLDVGALLGGGGVGCSPRFWLTLVTLIVDEDPDVRCAAAALASRALGERSLRPSRVLPIVFARMCAQFGDDARLVRALLAMVEPPASAAGLDAEFALAAWHSSHVLFDPEAANQWREEVLLAQLAATSLASLGIVANEAAANRHVGHLRRCDAQTRQRFSAHCAHAFTHIYRSLLAIAAMRMHERDDVRATLQSMHRVDDMHPLIITAIELLISSSAASSSDVNKVLVEQLCFLK